MALDVGAAPDMLHSPARPPPPALTPDPEHEEIIWLADQPQGHLSTTKGAVELCMTEQDQARLNSWFASICFKAAAREPSFHMAFNAATPKKGFGD